MALGLHWQVLSADPCAGTEIQRFRDLVTALEWAKGFVRNSPDGSMAVVLYKDYSTDTIHPGTASFLVWCGPDGLMVTRWGEEDDEPVGNDGPADGYGDTARAADLGLRALPSSAESQDEPGCCRRTA
ncbi:hypothetical protein LQ327_23100 [Actinomycetospora endophytica]|uniref:Uncharacterized protein n=1 Tax=Actinomycetospora endophytica TaxID=2291215 RepID=A0ABS8PEC2_9PSEU|nr:hypothetical protein [Actinomycetospora endophytica]MCD2196267.1 hypothetical protein [Actinomycetospora endophytica]